MSKVDTGAAPPQEGDWPPGYVPGQGFTERPRAQEPQSVVPQDPALDPPQDTPSDATAATLNDAPNGVSGPEPAGKNIVPLEKLDVRPQWVHCPQCNRDTQTRVQGRSEGKTKFMNVFWWPLPNRRHWWEKTHWYCLKCDKELAMQKYGKELQVTANQVQK
ncbi:uncharacterized protein F5Z01DRAFT_467021 [Emericellopsis atlantica]|uniref:LITAF domain-containing protein n=1 Tax=Emericellopsis atlantica TaxID=2614577 RepID=A0A9P8CJS2_9HYPO|nr:uncharacterized protein F5Z01DRAFT_467021 [Emericellopsis atlantica]KAG9249764.1 hypothetical protein F5Z01DRAFT_467021 [Emericellopsis atlantica]